MKKEIPPTHSQQSFRQKLFLDQFRETGNLSHSAEIAGVSRQLVYYWRKTSGEFAKLMLDAETESRDKECAYILKDISEKARGGSRDYQQFIRNQHGEKTLRSVMRGKNLTWKGLKV